MCRFVLINSMRILHHFSVKIVILVVQHVLDLLLLNVRAVIMLVPLISITKIEILRLAFLTGALMVNISIPIHQTSASSVNHNV